MRDLDWWEIGVRGIKIPFAQWPTLLACLLPAGLVFAASYVIFYQLAVAGIGETSEVMISAGKVARLAFEWSWMTALWHSTLRHVVTFPTRRNFWLYMLLFGLVGSVQELAQVGQSQASVVAVDRLDLASGGQFVVAFIFGIIWLPVIWIMLRLAIWPAAIVANRRWVSPTAIWQNTRGLSWDLLLIGAVIFIPAMILGGGLFFGVTLFVAANDLPYGTDVLIGTIAALGIYASAALCAAYLLAYHDIIIAPNPIGRAANARP